MARTRLARLPGKGERKPKAPISLTARANDFRTSPKMLSGVDLDDWAFGGEPQQQLRATCNSQDRARGDLFETSSPAHMRPAYRSLPISCGRPRPPLCSSWRACSSSGAVSTKAAHLSARKRPSPRLRPLPLTQYPVGNGVLLQPLRRVLDLDLIHLGCQNEVGKRESSDRVRAQIHPDVSVGSDVHIRVVPLLLGQDADLCHFGPKQRLRSWGSLPVAVEGSGH